MSKLRDHVPIASRPYRLQAKIKADFDLEHLLSRGHIRQALNLYQGAWLPASQAPKIVELREHLDETLRQAVLQSQDPELYSEAAKRLGDDLKIWENLLSHLPLNDSKYPFVATKVKKIKQKPN